MNTIVGRITRNAEINTLKNDKQVVNFSVAINDSYKTKQGEHKKTYKTLEHLRKQTNQKWHQHNSWPTKSKNITAN